MRNREAREVRLLAWFAALLARAPLGVLLWAIWVTAPRA